MATRYAVCVEARLAKGVKCTLESQGHLDKSHNVKKEAILGVKEALAGSAVSEESRALIRGGVVFLLASPAPGDADADADAALEQHRAIQGVLGIAPVTAEPKAQKQQQQQAAAAAAPPPRTAPPPLPSAEASASFLGVTEVPHVDASGFTPEHLVARMKASFADGTPVLWRGLPMGSCVESWKDLDHLTEKTAGQRVSAQVCCDDRVDLAGHRTKGMKANFSFVDMPFSELLQRASTSASTQPLPHISAPGERYYLRSVPEGKMKGGSHFPDMFPGLAADFNLEGAVGAVEGGGAASYHSSALRVTSPSLELWTHYDTMHNLLFQVVGEKEVTLFPPCCAPFLAVQGTSSRVDSVETPDPTLFPLASNAMPQRLTVTLRAGEALFIPELWFHHTRSCDASHSLAVNVFYKQKALEQLYHPKDFYGNKDLPDGLGFISDIRDLGSRALGSIPQPFRAFYAVRAAEALLAEAGLASEVSLSLTANRAERAAEVATEVILLTGAFGGIGAEILRGVLSHCRERVAEDASGTSCYAVVLPTRRSDRAALEGGTPAPAVAELLGEIDAINASGLFSTRIAVDIHYSIDLSERAPIQRLVYAVQRRRVGAATSVTLINNAAAVAQELCLTSDGVELQFAVSTLCPYRMALGFRGAGLSRVVNVASNWAGGFSVADVVGGGKRRYRPTGAYQASKQAQRMVTRILSRELPGVPVNACHPGVVTGTSVANALGLAEGSGSHTPEQAAKLPLAAAFPAAGAPPCSGKMLSGDPPVQSDDAKWEALEPALQALLSSLC